MIHAHAHPNPPFGYSRRKHADPLIATEAVATENLAATYAGTHHPALDDVTCLIRPGTVTALVGPNGAGKSSLLKCIAGLLMPSRGAVRVFGLAPGECHHRTAYLPQRGDIDWRFPVSVFQLVLAGRYVHLGWFRRPRELDKQIAAKALERMQIAALASRHIAELSGGQQQRALLARALAQGADLLLLDEPFNNLDAETRGGLRDLFAELKILGKTLLVATHDLEGADDYDQILHMRGGRIEVAREA